MRSNQTFKVTTLDTSSLELQHEAERKFYVTAQKKYVTDNKFDVASDLRALDRLIFLETMMHRWTSWLASGQDYDGLITPQQEEQIRKNIKETGPLISSIQNDLGLTKSQREKDQFESVGAYINKLQIAAKAHGIRREKQLTRSLDLINQLFSMVGAYRRSTDTEKKKLGIESPDQILEWIDVHMRAEYDEVDAYFREHDQKAWVGTL